MNDKFDLNEALEQIKAGAKIDGKDGVLAPLIKQLTEAALEAELESHLSQEIRNRKNGKSSKRMKSAVGEFELEVPRDRNGTFEPQIVKKHQRSMSDQIEEKILSLYALGNSYTQIRGHLEEIYGVSFSTAAISAVTVPRNAKMYHLRRVKMYHWIDCVLQIQVEEHGRDKPGGIYSDSYIEGPGVLYTGHCENDGPGSTDGLQAPQGA